MRSISSAANNRNEDASRFGWARAHTDFGELSGRKVSFCFLCLSIAKEFHVSANA